MVIAKEPDIGKNTRRMVFFLVVGLLMTSLPFWISRFGLALSTQIMYLSILVMSFTFMASHGGLLSLAQVSFFGIAGYTLGILSVKTGVPFPYPYLLGILTAAAAAAILGLIAIRVKAIPFLMMTLAFGEITYGTARHWSSLTNGDNGINDIPDLALFGASFSAAKEPIRFYYLVLVIFILCYWLLNKINHSPFGLAHQATKQSASRLEALGYPVFAIKYFAFIISAAYAGIAGLLGSTFEGTINPDSIWFGTIMFMMIAAILGGVNSAIGPIVGVTIAIVLERFIEPLTEHYRIVVGAVFLFSILLARQGIMGFIEKTRFYRRALRACGFD
jgi:branched-chain amino acid transport system permease protein